MTSERILPLRVMARRLGVTQKWLREQADAGVVPHLRAGNRYLFEPIATEESLAREAAKDISGRESVPGRCQSVIEPAAEQSGLTVAVSRPEPKKNPAADRPQAGKD